MTRRYRRTTAATLVAALVPLCAAADTGSSRNKIQASDAQQGLAYVSNQDGAISVIDLATLEMTASIDPGAEGPRGIGVSADGRWLVSANRESGDLTVIERASGKLLRHIAIGKNPEFVRVRGTTAFVSFEPESTGGPPPKPGTEPTPAAAHDDDDAGEPAQIAVVDLEQGKVLRNIVGGIETEGIEFSADGKQILITNEADDSITVHDIASGALVRTIDTRPYGPRPRGIKIAPDGQSYVASLELGNKLLVLDDAYKVVRTVDTGAVPYGLAFDRAGKRLFVALSRGQALQVFDTADYKPIAQIPTGQRCWHFSFTPDDAQLLVACGRSHEIVVIDANTYTEIKRIADAKLPWGIVTWPRSVGSLDLP